MITLNLDFAELSIQYLENPSEDIITKICSLPATDHLYYHAFNCNNDMDFSTKKDFITYILDKKYLKNIYNYKKILKELSISNGLIKEIENETLKSLPDNTHFLTNMYITLGYFPVGTNNNFNIDLSFNFNNLREIFYQSIHELHHVGFTQYNKIPLSLENIKTKGDLAYFISKHFHLEALGTYASYNIRLSDNNLNDSDYNMINNMSLIDSLKNEFIKAYCNLINNSNLPIEEQDFNILNNFWSGKRFAYILGLYYCVKISEKFGENALINSIIESTDKFMSMILTFC